MNDLLGSLTTTYNKILDLALDEQELMEKEAVEGEEEDLDGMFGGVAAISPAMLTSAANFLKQNDVTAQEELGDSMTELDRKLKKKQLKGRGKLQSVN